MCGFLSARARVVELVDTQVSEACASRCSGSSPLPGTILRVMRPRFKTQVVAPDGSLGRVATAR